MQWEAIMNRQVNEGPRSISKNTPNEVWWNAPLPSLLERVPVISSTGKAMIAAHQSQGVAGTLGIQVSSISSASGEATARFLGPLNVTSMPKEGKLRVTPGPLTNEDVQRVEQLVDKGATGTSTSLSNLRRYMAFRESNPQLESHALALMGFGAQQSRVGGLDPGSARNLTVDVYETLKKSGEKIGECPLLNRLLDGLKVEKAQKGANHALDISEVQAEKYMRDTKRADVRSVLWLMLTCGARVMDIIHIEELKQFLIDLVNRRIYIEFRVTKQRKDISDVFKAYFPFFVEPDAEVIRLLESVCLSSLPHCDSINKVLKMVCPPDPTYPAHPFPTTYSFRRVFDHRVIQWYTSEDGIVEWSKVIDWTAHKENRALRGHYAKASVLKLPSGVIPPTGPPKDHPLPASPTPAPVTTKGLDIVVGTVPLVRVEVAPSSHLDVSTSVLLVPSVEEMFEFHDAVADFRAKDREAMERVSTVGSRRKANNREEMRT